MPANASVATASTSTMCLADGVVNRWTCAVSRSGCMATIAPAAITASCRAMSDVAAEAGDVDGRRERDHDARDGDLRPPVREAAPDRAQVMRHRDRRQGDDDDVVDQDRPAGDEADQLVERVAGER